MTAKKSTGTNKVVAYTDLQRELADPVRSKFATINRKVGVFRKNDELRSTGEGARMVRKEISKLHSILESKISQLRGELLLPVTRGHFASGSFIIVHGPTAAEERLALLFEIHCLEDDCVTQTTLDRSIGIENKSNGVNEQSPKVRYSPFFIENGQIEWMKADREIHDSEQVVLEALTTFADLINELFKERHSSWENI